MNLLFWNIKRNDVSDYICDCIKENDVDIAAFAEHGGIDFCLLAEKLGGDYRTQVGMGGCEKVRVIVRRSIEYSVRIEQARYIIVDASVGGVDYVICFLHMRDRMHCNSNGRARDGEEIVNAVRNVSEVTKCNNLVLMGDFNANPYDDEMLLPFSFNVVLFKDLIQKSESCNYGGKQYKRLYNPVLNYISEDSKMYGSYYYLPSGEHGPVWNCLDMVLVGKPLTDRVTSLSYLRCIGGKSLMGAVLPDKKISDHLPLLVGIG